MRFRSCLPALSLLVAALAAGEPGAPAPARPTLLLRQPTLSRDHLAFVYAGDLWVAGRRGEHPARLTTHAAAEFAPHFSPDGRWIAFSAAYDGNTDVYVIPVEGGQPRRLTWHPAPDVVSGWSADGQRVLFASPREVANNRSNQLFEVPLEGGFERKVMEAMAFEGSWSPDGKRLAFRPYRQAYSGPSGWRQHRGGTTPPVWIIDPATQAWVEIPHVNASDLNPVWAGEEVVFISDRADGAANLFAYHPGTKALRQLTHETVWDVKSVDAHGSALVYEVGGRLKTLDLATGAGETLPIVLTAASAQARTQWKDAARQLESAQLSATGKRVVVSARGEVFTVPVKDGSVRNLTGTSGVREKDAQWSPDGLRVAYLSDAPGHRHQVVIQDHAGLEKPQILPLDRPGYFTLLAWSPEGGTLVLQDNHLNLYGLALAEGPAKGKLTLLDASPRRTAFSVAFSPDGRWLAYTVKLATHFSQIRLHDFATGRHQALTDGLSHADHPAFSPKGDLLFFTASVNTGPTQVFLDMSTQERPVRAGLYAAVLAADGRSPLLPKAGDEEPKAGNGNKEEGKGPKPTRIDFEGLAQRIVALPVAERNYDGLAVAADGALFYLERRQPGASTEPPDAEPAGAELTRFDFEERKAKALKPGVTAFSLSGDGKKLLLNMGRGKLEVGEATAKLEGKALDLGGLRVRVEPREEWRQIFEETWWMEQEFFYDPALHGLDWKAVRQRYLPLLEHVQRREDLNEVLVEMISELQVGHNRVGGGDVHQEPVVPVGLLGADFTFEAGRYRFKTIYAGDAWNPFLKAPLAVPGLGIKPGDFLLAVNGRPLEGAQNLYALLEHTVGKQVVLTVGPDPSGKGGRQVTVEPTAREAGLRQWAWIERNRQAVDKASGGTIAYVYLPDTAAGGFQYFNRMFFPQIDKQAVIIDDRRNGGGQAANYVTELLSRPYLASWKDRDGLVFDTPGGAIYGPKAMLIDQDAGSGGDFLPYAFKRVGLGPLIGKRTWGGLIGISVNPGLLDGGSLVVPFFRFFTPEGEWRIENEGVAPDREVELDPAAVNQGRDPQLEAAIAEVMARLKAWKPIQRTVAPPMPALGH